MLMAISISSLMFVDDQRDSRSLLGPSCDDVKSFATPAVRHSIEYKYQENNRAFDDLHSE